MKNEAIFAPATRRVDGFHDAPPAAIAAHAGEVHLVDVREPAEYHGELGHIDGAELVPLATLVQAAQRWDRAAPVVLICRSGARSARAANALLAMDFERVAHLAGGMLAWHAAALPTARHDAAGAQTHPHPHPHARAAGTR